MKIMYQIHSSIPTPKILADPAVLLPVKFLVTVCLVILTLATSRAQTTLYWDAGNTNDGAAIEPGSGNWDTDTTTNFNWNNGAGNVSWAQTSTTVPLRSAVFNGPDEPSGTYWVQLDGTQIAPSNMVFNANGYTFSGAQLYNAGGAADAWIIADGKTVVFSNNIAGGTSTFQAGTGMVAGATMVIQGNLVGGTPVFASTNPASIFFLGGANNTPAQFTSDGNVWFTNGLWTEGATFQIGRPVAPTQPNNQTGTFVLDGANTTMNLSTAVQMDRGNNAVATLTVQNGATLNLKATGANGHLQIVSDYNNNEYGAFYMKGGTVNLGVVGSSTAIGSIWLFKSGVHPTDHAIFSQSGGVINAWGGITIGSASSTTNGGTCAITNSGGFLYIGNGGGIGISMLAAHAATNYFVISGGTIGALSGWSSSVPMYLDVLNGNITFQTADQNGSAWPITLSGALTGPGGLNVTGSGTLQLSGANNYAGSTVVSNGTLKIIPTLSPVSGSLTLDGSAGSPIASMAIGNPGQTWMINGNLTYNDGTPTEDFNFGGLAPSTTVAPMQVANNVTLNVTPNFTIEGSGIYAATYPLIKYGGSFSGTLPLPVLPSGVQGYLSNSIASQVIALVVTNSTVTASFVWGIPNSGSWDFSTPNWEIGGGSLTTYSDNHPAQFDDTAMAPSPVTVTLNTTVHPGSVTILGTNTYTVLGKGAVADSSSPTTLSRAGSGTVALWGTNTYSGGTTVQAGQLDINFGGDGGADSAIGTGPLVLDVGAKLDNTSGQPVTLLPSITQTWQDDWTFVGTGSLNTGPGSITLGSAVITLNVVSNVLTAGGTIGDNGGNYKILKTGNGALTLATDNSFGGGLELDAGTVNLNSGGSAGSGVLTLSGGAMDNLSGSDVTLGGNASITIASPTVTYIGTSNALNLGSVPANFQVSFIVNFNVVSNILEFDGQINNGNQTLAKTGNGTLVIGGYGGSAWIGDCNQGEMDLGKYSGLAIGTGSSGITGLNGYGIRVHSNSVVRITSSTQQFPTGSYNNIILDTGGVLDFNGNSQNIDMMVITNFGIVRSSANGGLCAVSVLGNANSIHPTNAITINGTNCIFDVTNTDTELDINGIINGGGSLVKTGVGTVSLLQSNWYSGNLTVMGGILTVGYPDLTNAAIVTVASNAMLNLNYAVAGSTNIIGELFTNGVAITSGIHNATTDPLFLAGNGNLQIVPPVTVNPLPGPIQFSLSGSTLALSWPTNLGWILQSQTNSLATGLQANTNAWYDWPATANATSANMPVVPGNPTVFFRLRHP